MARRSSRSTSTWSDKATSCGKARDAALAIVQAVREPLVVLDADCRVGLANDAFYALLGETPRSRSRASTSGTRGTASGPSPDVRRSLRTRVRASSRSSTSKWNDRCRAAGRTLVLNTTVDRARRPAAARPLGRVRCDRRTSGRSVAHRCRDPAAGRQAEGRIPRHPGA